MVVVSLVVFWLELLSLVILLSVIVSGAVQHFLPHQHLTFLSQKFPPGSDSHSVIWVIPWRLAADQKIPFGGIHHFNLIEKFAIQEVITDLSKETNPKVGGKIKFSFWAEVRFNLLSNQFAGVELIWICRFDKQGIGFYKYLTKLQFS